MQLYYDYIIHYPKSQSQRFCNNHISEIYGKTFDGFWGKMDISINNGHTLTKPWELFIDKTLKKL